MTVSPTARPEHSCRALGRSAVSARPGTPATAKSGQIGRRLATDGLVQHSVNTHMSSWPALCQHSHVVMTSSM